jgi:DNA protecting protein DprA
MNTVSEQQARLALFSVIEGGQVYWSNQIREFGSQDVYGRLLDETYDPVKFRKLIDRLKAVDLGLLEEQIEKSGAQFITPESTNWPPSLNDLNAAPIGLVVKGDLSALSERSLAIVGTRNPTPYGVRNAGDFAAGFVDREWNIVSGGAYGIDSAAHKGALIAEGRTIAVLATGIDVAYPAGNVHLFAEIAENGALVSEVLPGAHAIPSRFLTRNRIIAALSQATLVVEAAFRSGSLRTARDAAELMRPVMAIPGPISAPTSEGCHRLIGERAAEIVTSVTDAIELISAL